MNEEVTKAAKAHIKWMKETEEGRRWAKLVVEANKEDEKARPHTRRARKLRSEARRILEQR